MKLMHHFASSAAVFCLNHGSYRWETHRALGKQPQPENCKFCRWTTRESHRITSGRTLHFSRRDTTTHQMFPEEILFIVKLKQKQPKAAPNLEFYVFSVKPRVFSVSASRSVVHMETHVRVLASAFSV